MVQRAENIYIVRSHLCFKTYLSGRIDKCKKTLTLNCDYLWGVGVLKKSEEMGILLFCIYLTYLK